eukprot:scaffold12431_cov57-Attheya_sp.AAC.7
MQYYQELREILKKESDQSGCEIPYSYFVKATIQAAEMTIQGEGRVSKDWFQHSKEELLRAINLKNYWFNVWTHTLIEKAKVKLNEARRNRKSKISEAKKAWHKKRAKEVHDMQFHPKNAWLAIKEIQAGMNGHHTM